MGTSNHRKARDRSPAIGSRKLNKDGKRSPYTAQRSPTLTPATSDTEGDVEEIARHPQPLSTRELMIRRLEGPMATAIMQKTMQARLQVLGAKHPDTMKIMRTLSVTWFKQHRYDKADNIKCLLLDLCRTVMKGDNNVTSIEAMEDLARSRSRRGYFDKCEELESRALELRNDVCGLSHPETIRSAMSLATTWLEQRRFQEAEANLTQALQLSAAINGESHVDMINAMITLGIVKRSSGKDSEAFPLESRAYQATIPLLKSSSMNTLDAIANLAYVAQMKGNLEFAEKLQMNAIAFYKKVLGEKDPNTIGSMRALAIIWHRQGLIEAAKTLLAQALVLLDEVFGDKHPHAKRMKEMLEGWRNSTQLRPHSSPRDAPAGVLPQTPMPGAWPEEDEVAENHAPFKQVSLTIPGKIDAGGEHEAVKFLRKPIPVVEHSRYFGSGFRWYGDF